MSEGEEGRSESDYEEEDYEIESLPARVVFPFEGTCDVELTLIVCFDSV